MNKYDVLKRIEDKGIVAVVRANNPEEAIKISDACLKGGIDSIEITFTIPGAENVIRELISKFTEELLVGAGTVLDSETARIAILAGAKFIVSPGFDLETAKLCNRYRVPYMAGCVTINEMIRALEAGVDIIKLFPGSAFGAGYVKSVKAPLPQAPIMPTGGVDINNVDQWIKNGCIAVGVGGKLTAGAKTGDFESITKLSKEFIEKIKEARK
ncbi:2-dehydro-3-deoxyphosphogluconate aldolase/(4S)-4-hydroxy-2-oxoglutarate aldolase [Clostridium moniliforme]|uniref:2-dehydro-3-deoxyphosphogluconate aldolase/(4S)-4-hydroxy-2-oxoglutarate aldolase n=1 Tax=Clostridium moniliforme TaxID=39489 RepID=A0ABS4F1S4_9CLOT|nr:bifunctional 2-keto-4-hydroxyglutarate aldolase/2-keto-3-deoxy-6-phosphogluconate aldolase [Clostridium moniliforme]MBP1890212.1 2-dehydro-3-deoxyphosphogluconate aldolase/(4S)-4-hydroxy-2-oxoglutarate aldolase [Clostridium moniliforme]